MREVIADVIWYIILFGPVLLFYWLMLSSFRAYREYHQKNYQLGLKRSFVEIRMPEEILKTPLAMELFFNGIWFKGRSGEWIDNLTYGKSRPIFSFEIASTEGDVRFYMRLEDSFRPMVEAQLYAQYPSIEIVDALDYTRFIEYDYDRMGMIGYEWILGKADPYPIKTYKHYGLDQTKVEVEEKSDPIAQTLEVMGHIGKNEHMWLQIVFRAHKKDVRTQVGFFEWFKSFFMMFNVFTMSEDMVEQGRIFFTGRKRNDWGAEGRQIIEDIRARQQLKLADGTYNTVQLTPEEKIIIQAIEENISKPAFDCGLRTVILGTDKNTFSRNHSKPLIDSMWSQYGSTTSTFNYFKKGLGLTYDFAWEDVFNYSVRKIHEDFFRDYKSRTYFFSKKRYAHGKIGYKMMTLSSEELATIYHLPGQAVQTPTFERIESTTGQAPANLPV